MKKILTLALAAATLLTAASCQKEGEKATDGDANVRVSVGLPATKAIGDGTSAKQLCYEVYYRGAIGSDTKGWTLVETVVDNESLQESLSATIDFTLLRGSEYVVLFWAQAPNSPYTFDDEKGMRKVHMNYQTTPTGNLETRDAFCGYMDITVGYTDSDQVLQCDLFRPFAQLNFVSTDFNNITGDDIKEITLEKSEVKVSKLPPFYYIYPGSADGDANLENDVTFVVDGAYIDEPFEHVDYEAGETTWMSMNYVLLPTNATSVDVHAKFTVTATYANDEEVEHVVYFADQDDVTAPRTVAAQTNYRTNIIGDFFTGSRPVTVTIKPGMLGDNDVKDLF